MDRHLVAVKIGIKRRTNKGMKLYRSAFDKYRFKRLNTKSVKRGRTVKKHRMLLNYFSKYVPYGIIRAFNLFLRVFNIMRAAVVYKLFHYKRLKQLKRHFFRQTALIYFKLRTYNDNRTSRIVNTLTEKVLTETSLLTFQHIRK